MRCAARPWRTAGLATAALALCACAPLLGLDEYDKAAQDAGVLAPVGREPCAEHEVVLDGACAQVGVPTDECGDGFTPDGRGGCEAILPAQVCPGALARPGDRACSPLACNEPPAADTQSATLYVDAAADDGGDGDVRRPFRRITDALDAAAESARETTVWLADGEYRERLVVRSPVQLRGSCAGRVRLIGGDDSRSPCQSADGCAGQALIAITADGSGSSIAGLELEGGALGVRIDGANGVVIRDTRIHDVDGAGVRIETRATRASATIEGSLIEAALGAGILAYGADVSLASSTIRGTRAPRARGPDTCGICTRAASIVPTDDEMVWDARASVAGSLEVIGSLIEDNAGSGISVIGVRAARVSTSVVRASAGAAQLIGIEAEERIFGNVPAAIALRQSVVSGMKLAGVRARNAYVSIERSSVGDVTGASEDDPGRNNGRCLGNGVRVLWDRAPEDDASEALLIRASAIERTHESAVLIAGATARVERSIVRDTHADDCAGGLGDGIALHGFAFAPARLALEQSRIEASARAALAGFGDATATVHSSALVGASEPLGLDAELDETYCQAESDEAWATCTPAAPALEPELLGGHGCKLDDTVCIRGCDLGPLASQPGAVLSPELSVWILDHDEIAPVRVDPIGCYELEGLPRKSELLRATAVVPERDFVARVATASAASALAPVLTPVNTDLADASAGFSMIGPVPFKTVGLIEMLQPRPTLASGPIDLAVTPVMFVYVCAPDPARRPDQDACRTRDHRVPGVRVALDVDNSVYYPSSDQGVNDESPGTLAGAVGSIGLFRDVAPGERVITLEPTSSSRLACTGDTGVGWQSATRSGEGFRVVARPGFLYNVPIFCQLAVDSL